MSKRTLTAISDLMEDLFNGKIYPAEQITSKSPRCREVEKEITAAMTDLENTLDKETYSKIEHVSDLFVEETDIMGTEYFKCGLALGLQLMQESQEIVRYFGRSPDADEAEED